ncbi:hypothetical protein SAMN04489729_1901 [Amycolatopsis lurida]|uniref:DUF7715 domain-containing protein n=1 Tax=Amycolatopsis lurida NRRL 2430 TaxID=1460371 RepID=A0A2P2FGW8_AMYLU|nr:MULTISPECIES: hypothetical protein [Amycolatopsis]KFU75976.1 hypothetical protein BB31_38340 [Amycolatopsis lurida NRRL 2430]QXV58086.1 hypothetical protein CVV72_14570 [Amycolatopsis sp. TNS106]SEC57421.1 hypothetical protein SAMN04489729_1901 [Amycolatopsis lurida]
MKLLVATAKTQGARENDFDHCVEGELLWVAPPCGDGESSPDSRCGCGRAFGGLSSHRGTTTALVADLPGFTFSDYADALRSSLAAQGWPPEAAEDVATDLLALASEWEVGTVLERRDDWFAERLVPAPPG